MHRSAFAFPLTRGLALLRRSAVAAVLCVGTSAGWAAPDWDVVGFKLGMSLDQARAAMKAYNARGQMKESLLKFSYSDGARQQETESFVASLEIYIPAPPGTMDSETLSFEFTPPPQPQRLVRIRRTVATWSNPPSDERMLDSLTQKYGKPASLTTTGIGTRNRNGIWVEPGKPICGHQRGRQIGMIGVGPSPRDLQRFRQYQQQGTAPRDLSTCSALLQANMVIHQGGSSVVGLEVVMQDYGAQLPALEATARWLEELEANARKARLNSGSAPKL